MLSNSRNLRPASALAVTSAADFVPLVASPEPQAARIIAEELIAGFRVWPIWAVMGWEDIRQRYRRSILGPFWITASMGFFVLILGVIYSRLFHTPLEHYMPFLCVGYILWGFIASSINEACNVFSESAGIIKQIKLPYSVYVMRVIWRNFIVFLHTIVVYIPVAIYFKVEPTPLSLLALPGLFIVVLNQVWVTIVVGVLATRYRDILPIIATMIQLLMFATPIMWMVGAAQNLQLVADLNPVYHLIEIVRAPALGVAPQPLSWLVSIGVTFLGWGLASALLVRAARRIVYWL